MAGNAQRPYDYIGIGSEKAQTLILIYRLGEQPKFSEGERQRKLGIANRIRNRALRALDDGDEKLGTYIMDQAINRYLEIGEDQMAIACSRCIKPEMLGLIRD